MIVQSRKEKVDWDTQYKCNQVHAAAAKKNDEKLSKSKDTKGMQKNFGQGNCVSVFGDLQESLFRVVHI